MKIYLLSLLFIITYAWTNAPTYIAIRIAQLDLKVNDQHAYNKTMMMLSPLNKLTFSESNPFLDAAVYTDEASRAGYSLTDNWFYQFTPYFDGIVPKETEQHKDFNLLKSIQGCQSAVDYNGGSRIDKTFGKSYCLRYIFNQVINLHQPMHNIIRFSESHPDGDEFGKLHKISGSKYSFLFDLFEDAFGFFSSPELPSRVNCCSG